MKFRLVLVLMILLLCASAAFAVQKVVGDEKTALNSARIYITQGNWDKALAQFSIVLKRYPDNIESLIGTGDIYAKFAQDTVKYGAQKEELISKAYTNYTAAINAMNDPSNIETNPSKREDQLKQLDHATKFQAICLGVMMNNGANEFNKGNFVAAIPAFQKIVDIAPTYFLAYRYISSAYANIADATTDDAAKQQALAKALEYAEKAVQNSNESADRSSLAQIYYSKKDYSDALKYFDAAYQIAHDTESLYNMSLCYSALNDTVKAFDMVKQVAKLDSTNVDVMIQCSNLALRFGQDDLSIEYNKKAADIGSDSPAVYLQLCFKYYKKVVANNQKAAQLQQQLDSLKPKDTGRAALESQIAQLKETNKPIYRNILTYSQELLKRNPDSIDGLTLAIEAANVLGETSHVQDWQTKLDALSGN